MAGKRMLHSNICESSKLSTVSYAAETLYYRLMTRTDDDGNFTADPRIVLGQCMPLREDMSAKKVEALLIELSSKNGDKLPLIQFYEKNGDRFLHITRFEEFQYLRPDRTPTVSFPTHPPYMGPTLVNQRFTNGKPNVNQTDTICEPKSEDAGIPKSSQGKISEFQENIKEGSPVGHQSNWKMFSTKYHNIIGKFASKTKANLTAYAAACEQYGEDDVLKVFDEWAKQNKPWLIEKGNPCYYFWSQLPELIEAVTSSEKIHETEKFVEVNHEVLQQEIERSTQETEQENLKKLEELEKQEEWAKAHQNEI